MSEAEVEEFEQDCLEAQSTYIDKYVDSDYYYGVTSYAWEIVDGATSSQIQALRELDMLDEIAPTAPTATEL